MPHAGCICDPKHDVPACSSRARDMQLQVLNTGIHMSMYRGTDHKLQPTLSCNCLVTRTLVRAVLLSAESRISDGVVCLTRWPAISTELFERSNGLAVSVSHASACCMDVTFDMQHGITCVDCEPWLASLGSLGDLAWPSGCEQHVTW
jgi:hypothetical protein